ncbi:hypothetical protein FACS189416_7940 [Bacteroidia bacterium]|nr:hypothetical protein FACS189416_7940 [Bacteroidia bacterium]
MWLILIALFFTPFIALVFGEITKITVGDLYLFGLPNLFYFFLIWAALFVVVGVTYLIVLTQHKISLQKKLLEVQKTQAEIDDLNQQNNRYTQAVESLGSAEEAIRIGGASNLYMLAGEYPAKYGKSVFDLLCYQLRTMTNKPDFKDRSANELPTMLSLLFTKEGNPFPQGSEGALQHANFPEIMIEDISLRKVYFCKVDLFQVGIYQLRLFEGDAPPG